MISNNHPQNLFLSQSTKSTRPPPPAIPKKAAADLMVASYDDVFGFSDEDEIEIDTNQHQPIKNGFTKNGDHQKRLQEQQKSITMKSSNGIIVSPQPINPKPKFVLEPKLKSKSNSIANPLYSRQNTIENDKKKNNHESQRRLVAVIPPKPPSNFQTLPSRKPMISAPKPNMIMSNSFSMTSSFNESSATKTTKEIPSAKFDQELENSEIQGRVKAMRQVFATLPAPIRTRPPIPISKDYHGETANNVDQTDHRSHAVPIPVQSIKCEKDYFQKNATVSPPNSKSIRAKAQELIESLSRDLIDNGDQKEDTTTKSKIVTPIAKSPPIFPLAAPQQPPPPPLPKKEKTSSESMNGMEINGASKVMKGARTISSSIGSGDMENGRDSALEINDRNRNKNAAEADGAFLIRYKSSPCTQSPYSLSVLQSGKIYHLQIRRKSNGTYALGDSKANELEFAQLHEIVAYHRRHALQLIRRKSGEVAGYALLTSAPMK